MYAQRTQVSADRSEGQLKTLLARAGAAQIITGWDGDGRRIMLAFRLARLSIRIVVPLPTQDEARRTPKGRIRAARASAAAMDQETRRRWRALLLVVKAKLEAVSSGISTMEQEFLAHVVIPGGQTIGDVALPQLRELADSGKSPVLMLTDGGTP